jgi:uncharacterized protein YgiM (DUF1202 family)
MRLKVSKRMLTAKMKDGQLKAAFVLSADKGDALRPIKEGRLFYPFISADGEFAKFGGIFSVTPTDATNKVTFQDQADYFYSIETPADEEHKLAAETLNLKGSRLSPTYLDIKKIKDIDDTHVYVEGVLNNASDPRLIHLDRTEDTVFGYGQFSMDKVKASHTGDYIYLHMSPHAEDIQKVADEQKSLVDEYMAEPNDVTKNKITKTMRMLSPHAYEIYKNDNGIIYYIASNGQWRCENLYGLRDLDVHDRKRIREFLDKEDITNVDFRKFKEEFHKEHLLDRMSLKTSAPIFIKEVQDKKEDDEKELGALQDFQNKVKPKDWEAVAGIKEGVDLIPHQPYTLQKLKDVKRDLIDEDPGAGKTVIASLDVLQQIAAGRVKRPLIVMPNHLLGQFAGEVKEFTELNPWIISTESIKNWKEGTSEKFIEDASKAPINTVFLTSYPWLIGDRQNVPNGKTVKIKTVEGNEKLTYKTITVYPRAKMLLDALKVDALYLDEVHILANNSHRTRAVATMAGVPIVRGMSGTIMPGNPLDLTGSMGVIH